jgi:hypothetical protein
VTQRNITSKGRSAKAAHTDDPGPEPQREFLLLDGSATGQPAGACRKRLAVRTARTLITTARDARRDHHGEIRNLVEGQKRAAAELMSEQLLRDIGSQNGSQ